MLGSDRSRGYCLEMICADFLAGANLDNGDPGMLLFAMKRFFRFLTNDQKQEFLNSLEVAAERHKATMRFRALQETSAGDTCS
jgi:hypothetical protein